MIAFPNAKINLGLDILSKRPDAYHNISSCFYPIGWSDVLEIIPSNEFQFTSSGLAIAGNTESNLCVKAYKLLSSSYKITPVHIHLHKIIPMGAGLGGGSSDGAFTLKLLNQLLQLDIPIEKLKLFAAQLGSDCTFFIENTPALVTGVGEIINPISFSLSAYQLVVIYPKIHVSTASAFQEIIPQYPDVPIEEIISGGIVSFKGKLKNDFENSIFKSTPELAKIKEMLYEQGAIYASMSGSGSALYGIFNKKTSLDEFEKKFAGNAIWRA